MNRRRIVMIAVIAGAAAALSIGGILLWRALRKPVPVTLTFVHPLNDEAEARVMRDVLADFHSLYPHITVLEKVKEPASLRGAGLTNGAGENADVMVATGPALEGAGVWAGQPRQWTGTLWVLAARRDVLSRMGDLSDKFQALREGRMSATGFEELLGQLKSRGTTPLTLGNSHHWPFLIWLQHWAAATVGFQAVRTMPSGKPEQDKAFLDRLRPAFTALSRWKAQGWFSSEAWEEGWARGLAPLADGSAVFALVSPLFISAFPAETRLQLDYFPFPGSRNNPHGEWNIGSVYLLGTTRVSTRKKDAAILERYLTSPGVTAVLSSRLGRPFFSWSFTATRAPEVLPDWYTAANTPEFRILENAFGSP
jgi:ABC-type glycerol-3-phosphate transport system substrate-binding protein